MNNGTLLLLSLVGSVVFIVVATTRWKLHPFLALLAPLIRKGLLPRA